MTRRLAALALLTAVAGPAWAQEAPVAPTPTEGAAHPAAPVVDAAIVGAWELAEVEARGRMAVFGAVIETMDCTFEAEGEGAVEMGVMQDREKIEADRSFTFVTEAGQIVVNGAEPVGYELLDDGDLRLSMPDGLVVRLRRAAPEADVEG